jgi:hypothetical protein
MRITALALLLVLYGLPWNNSPLFAQRTGGARGGQQKKGESERIIYAEFDTAPFDMTREQLPPMYLGQSIQVVYQAIEERRTGSVDVAEAATQDPKNGKPAVDFSGTGIRNFDNVYAFRIVPAENFYSSGDQTLQSYCPLSRVLANGVEDETRKGFRVDYSPQVDNHYVYTDDKGKQVEIEEVKFRDYTIAFENLDQFSVEKAVLPGAKQVANREYKKNHTVSPSDDASEHEMIMGKFKLRSTEAKQFKESISLLAVCVLVSPYVTSDVVHRIGTPEKPGEYLAQHEYLHVRLLELWFYDFETGKVLMKMKPTHTASTT